MRALWTRSQRGSFWKPPGTLETRWCSTRYSGSSSSGTFASGTPRDSHRANTVTSMCCTLRNSSVRLHSRQHHELFINLRTMALCIFMRMKIATRLIYVSINGNVLCTIVVIYLNDFGVKCCFFNSQHLMFKQ